MNKKALLMSLGAIVISGIVNGYTAITTMMNSDQKSQYEFEVKKPCLDYFMKHTMDKPTRTGLVDTIIHTNQCGTMLEMYTLQGRQVDGYKKVKISVGVGKYGYPNTSAFLDELSQEQVKVMHEKRAGTYDWGNKAISAIKSLDNPNAKDVLGVLDKLD